MQKDYRNKKIVIIGAGSTGCSLMQFFCAQGAQVTLSDNRSADLLSNLNELEQGEVTLDLGGHTHAFFIFQFLPSVDAYQHLLNTGMFRQDIMHITGRHQWHLNPF